MKEGVKLPVSISLFPFKHTFVVVEAMVTGFAPSFVATFAASPDVVVVVFFAVLGIVDVVLVGWFVCSSATTNNSSKAVD